MINNSVLVAVPFKDLNYGKEIYECKRAQTSTDLFSGLDKNSKHKETTNTHPPKSSFPAF